jgi:hypothetical protein
MSEYMICGVTPGPPGLPDDWSDTDGGVPCCMPSAMGGPSDCTCWQPIFDVDQAELVPSPGPRRARSEQCHDCAYLAGSRELTDPDDRYTRRQLLDLPHGDRPFWCHQGIRRVIAWEHPDGRVISAAEDDYRPPIRSGRPFQADGSSALVCAGWQQRHDRVTQTGDG